MRVSKHLKFSSLMDEKSVQESVHDCIFYGYYAGTEEEVLADLNVTKIFHKPVV